MYVASDTQHTWTCMTCPLQFNHHHHQQPPMPAKQPPNSPAAPHGPPLPKPMPTSVASAKGQVLMKNRPKKFDTPASLMPVVMAMKKMTKRREMARRKKRKKERRRSHSHVSSMRQRCHMQPCCSWHPNNDEGVVEVPMYIFQPSFIFFTNER